MQLPRSVAGQPLQSCGIVPKRRKVPPPPGLPFLQRLRQSPDCPSRFFVSPPHPVVPLVAFADASQQSPSAPSLPPRSRHSATIRSAAAPPGACGANSHDRKRRHVAHPSRSRREVPPEKGGIGRKHTHFFVISRNFFEQVPVHSPMRPDNAHDQSAPQRLCGRKHHPPSRFLPSDLHLCPFLPIFAPIHVRKTSHPPSSSGLGLDSSPRPAAAIGGENLSLP